MMPAYKYSNCIMTRSRELGLKSSVGYMDGMCKNMYSVMGKDYPKHEKQCMDKGGVFNMEFSKDGNLLVVACQENSLVIYDTFNQKFIFKLMNAHNRCVNCIKYINDHTFASGSDDGLVKLWDTRNPRRCKQTFSGHTNWVKNIDYSERENMMISSSLDGNVFAWDINSTISDSSRKLFIMNALMRTKLSPDSTKMVVATTSGFIVLVHDLVLDKLESDFNTFRPNLYRLMQVSDQTFPAATMYNHLFSQQRKRNRFEFISDFPKQAEIINSIQIHPKGWCALSRSVSQNDEEEWTTVHDIQTKDKKDYAKAFKYVLEEAVPKSPDLPSSRKQTYTWPAGCVRTRSHLTKDPFFRTDNRSYCGTVNSTLYDTNNRRHTRKTSKSKKIMTNLPRMTHFIEELYVGKGFIKEPCFSPDGRVMCSPHGNGVRLFSFNKEVQEFNLCMPKRPKKLHTLNPMSDFHDDVVVCCQFNPINNYQLVTGCLGGRVVWCAPKF